MPAKQIDLEEWHQRVRFLFEADSKDEAALSQARRGMDLLYNELSEEQALASPDATMAKAMLAFKMNMLDSALKSFEKCAIRWPETAEEAHLNIADIYLKRNNFGQAEALLASTANRSHPIYLRLKKSLAGRRKLRSSSLKYCNALKHFQSGQFDDFRRETLSALVDLRGEKLATHSQIKALVHDLYSSRVSDLPVTGQEFDDNQSTPTAVFAAGFGYSGSGAVFDFLRQHQDVKVFSVEELNFFYSRQGDIQKLFDAMGSQSDYFDNTLCETILHGVLGLSEYGEKVDYIEKSKRRALLHACVGEPQQIDGLITAARYFVRDLRSLVYDTPDRIQIFLRVANTFFASLFRLKSAGGKFILFSNAIQAHSCATLKFLPQNCLVVACRRDRRDAYADRFTRGERLSVTKAIQDFTSKHTKYQSAISDPNISNQIVEVWFEDIVQYTESREELLLKLGMDPARLNDNKHAFDSQKSAKNIGIHAHFSDQEAIRMIEKKLPGHLY